MKKFTYILLAFITIVTLNSCEQSIEPLGTNYVTFAEPEFSAGVDVGGSTTVEIPVFTSNVSGSARTFVVSVDESSNAATGSYTVPTSVEIPANTNKGMITVSLTDTNLGIGVNKLILNFGAEEGLSNGGSTTISYIQNCTEVTGTLDITFDAYGSETSWEITDSLGGVVVSGGGYADGDVSVSEPITLCSGRDYTFTFKDSFGDGYASPGMATLTIGGDVKATVSGDFGSSSETEFDTK
ncbi:hypothetical protein FDT66_10230 [Polaribacter aestuariivivens]|uniref:DUF1735 domain-containing protein n=1 Tax=Polaribacter aestuariivivens TaxID=2304626 RepID=A0A5S3N2Q7_9FLAO|nr:hypothetical protein [Polaribacter aestuariivivens]TMM29493.1 hypothetical protein FDT66_10230 [Polaribacter aestuariivivens]